MVSGGTVDTVDTTEVERILVDDELLGTARIPDEVEGNPDEVEGNPDEVEGNPDGVEGNPDEVEGNPGDVSTLEEDALMVVIETGEAIETVGTVELDVKDFDNGN